MGSLGNIIAQDDHYWAQQYGALSTLMGGAVVSGVNDNSAVYYNPAALAMIDNPSLSIDANVYRIDKILIRNGAGDGVNLNSSQLSVYPQIISGMINLFKSGKVKLSYTMLTRNHSNILINTRYTGKQIYEIPGYPGLSSTSFVTAFDYVNQINEQWFGIGAGYQATEKLGIGMSLFTSYRGQSYQLTNYIREVSPVDSGYMYGNQTNDEAIKYYTLRLIAKFGLIYSTGNWKYGMTLTTPSIGIFGRGNIQRELSNIIISDNPGYTENNFIIGDRQTNIKAAYRHPVSIAMGLEYYTSKTRLSVSAEYFLKIKEYTHINPAVEPFIYPPSFVDSIDYKPLIDNFLHVENAAKSVLNVAIGYNQKITKNLSLILGAATDFSSYLSTARSNILLHGFGDWDIYHLSAGLSYHREKHTVTMGLSYAVTPSKAIQPYSMVFPKPETSTHANLSANSYSIVLGYTYFFARL